VDQVAGQHGGAAGLLHEVICGEKHNTTCLHCITIHYITLLHYIALHCSIHSMFKNHVLHQHIHYIALLYQHTQYTCIYITYTVESSTLQQHIIIYNIIHMDQSSLLLCGCRHWRMENCPFTRQWTTTTSSETPTTAVLLCLSSTTNSAQTEPSCE
jgi:hypothetical protein